MASTYLIKVVKGTQVVVRKAITLGVGQFTDPILVKAQAGVMYHLAPDDSNTKALGKLSTKRVGKNLHIALQNGNINKPDLVIEDYFVFNKEVRLATSNSDGELVQFAASTDVASSALSSEKGEAIEWSGASTGELFGISTTMLAAGGAVGVLALAKASKSSDTVPAGATKIAAYASDNKNPAPAIADYQASGTTGVTASNIDSINSAVTKVKPGTAAAEIQKIIDAYDKILAEANGSSSPDADAKVDPTVADYKAVGAKILGAESTAEQLTLLNEIVKNRTTTEVGTVAKIDALAAIADKIIAYNAKGNVPPAGQITAADFASIDIYDTSPSAADKAQLSVTQATALIEGIKAKGEGKSSTLSDIRVINSAYLKILAEADGTKLNTLDAAKRPTLDDFLAIGAKALTLMGKTNTVKALVKTDVQNVAALMLLNDSIDGLAATKVNTLEQINKLIFAVDKVMDVVKAPDGATAEAVELKAEDLTRLGMTGVTDSNIGFITKAISAQRSAAGAEAGDSAKVDTLKKLQGLVDLGVVMAYADTSTTLHKDDLRRVPAHIAPVIANYTAIGVVEKDEGLDKAIKNIAAVNSAVNAIADSTKVDSKAELQALVNTFDKLLAMADSGTSGFSKNNTDNSQQMTVLDYQKIGALNYNARGEAVSLALNKSVVPTVSQATKTDVVGGSALKLLNNIVDNLASTAVSSIDQINTIALTVDKIMAIASGDAELGISSDKGLGASTKELVTADLSLLGLTALSASSSQYLKLVVQGIKAVAMQSGSLDTTKIDTLEELQSALDFGVVMAYADTSPNITPTPMAELHIAPTAITTYTSLGVVKSSNASHKAITNLSSINSAVEALSSSSKIDSAAKIQTLVDNYDKVFQMADGTKLNTVVSKKLTTTDYESIGALAYDANGFYTATSASKIISTATSDQKSAALALLNDVVDNASNTSVDTIIKINTLAQIVDKIMATTNAEIPAKTLTLADFNTLGLSNLPSASTDSGFLDVFKANLTATSNDGTGVDSLKELQSWATFTIAQRYAETDGSNGALAAPSYQNYQDLDSGVVPGLSDVTWSDNLARAVNSALLPLDALAVTTTKLRDMATSYQSILNEAKDGSAVANSNLNPSALDYTKIGVGATDHLFPNAPDAATSDSALKLLNDVIRNKTASDWTALSTLKNMVTIIDKIETLILDTSKDGNTANWSTTNTAPATTLQLSDFTSLGLSMVLPSAYSSTSLTSNQFNSFLLQIAKETSTTSFESLDKFKTLLNTSAVFSV